jgi:hypothetical protein
MTSGAITFGVCHCDAALPAMVNGYFGQRKAAGLESSDEP